MDFMILFAIVGILLIFAITILTMIAAYLHYVNKRPKPEPPKKIVGHSVFMKWFDYNMAYLVGRGYLRDVNKELIKERRLGLDELEDRMETLRQETEMVPEMILVKERR